MSDIVNFLLWHGEAFVFLYVLADQLGVPVPAVPALLAMGALAGVGKISFGVVLLLSVLASLLADTIWYLLGRTRGGRVLRVLCKIWLEEHLARMLEKEPTGTRQPHPPFAAFEEPDLDLLLKLLDLLTERRLRDVEAPSRATEV